MEIAQSPSVNVDFGSRRNRKEGTYLFDEKITKDSQLNEDGRLCRRPKRSASNWTNLCIKEGFSDRNKRCTSLKSNFAEDEQDAGENQKLMMPGDRSVNNGAETCASACKSELAEPTSHVQGYKGLIVISLDINGKKINCAFRRNMTNGEVHKDVAGVARVDNTFNSGVTFISDETAGKFSQHVRVSNIRAVTRCKRKHPSRQPHCNGNGTEAESKEDFLRNNVNGIKGHNYSKRSVVKNHVNITSKCESITESNCGLEVPIVRSNVTRLKRKRKDDDRNGRCLVNGACVKPEIIRDKQKPCQEGAQSNDGSCHEISTRVDKVEKAEIAGDQTESLRRKVTVPKHSDSNISRLKGDNSNGIPKGKSTGNNFVNTNQTNFKPVRLKRNRITRNLGPNDTEPRKLNHDRTTDKEDVSTISCHHTSSVRHKNNNAHKATANNDSRLNNDEKGAKERDKSVNKLEICKSKDADTVKFNGRKHRLNRHTVINGAKFSDVRVESFNKNGTVNVTCGTAVKENGSTVDKRIETLKIWNACSLGTTKSYTKEGVLRRDDESRVINNGEAEVKRNGPSLDPCGTSSMISDIDGSHKVSVDNFMKGGSVEIDVTSQCYCKWTNCHEKLNDALELKQHVKELHVKGMIGSDLFFCFWEGCKVYNKPSSSYKWLVKHVNFHVGVRPFQCVIEPCQLSFASQSALIRHVQSHFNHRSKYYKKPEDASKEANATPGKDEEVNSGSESSGRKKMKNRRLQLFMRRKRPATSCQNDDPLDRSSTDYIKKKLFGLEKASIDACKPTVTSFWRNGQVLGKRISPSGKSQYLMEHPSPGRGYGSWLDETVLQNNNLKQMSKFKLSNEKKDELCSKIFGYSKRPRGRKRK